MFVWVTAGSVSDRVTVSPGMMVSSAESVERTPPAGTVATAESVSLGLATLVIVRPAVSPAAPFTQSLDKISRVGTARFVIVQAIPVGVLGTVKEAPKSPIWKLFTLVQTVVAS